MHDETNASSGTSGASGASGASAADGRPAADVPAGFDTDDWDRAIRSGRARLVEPPAPASGRLPPRLAFWKRFLTLTVRSIRLRWRRRSGA